MVGGWEKSSAAFCLRAAATRKVGLPARLIRKGIKDAEGRWSKSNREPGCRGRFLLHYGKAAAQKTFHVSLLSGFCLQSNQQCHFHRVSHLPSPYREQDYRTIFLAPHA